MARDRAKAPSRQLFGEQSRCDCDAIMTRLKSHHLHSASDSLGVGGRLALRASKALTAYRQPPQ